MSQVHEGPIFLVQFYNFEGFFVFKTKISLKVLNLTFVIFPNVYKEIKQFQFHVVNYCTDNNSIDFLSYISTSMFKGTVA